MRVKASAMGVAFLLAIGAGYWLATTAVPKLASADAGAAAGSGRKFVPGDDPVPRVRHERDAMSGGDHDAAQAGAIEGQRVLMFADAAARDRFLAQTGDHVRILGRLDALLALRVGFDRLDDLLGLLAGDEQPALIFPVTAPLPVDGEAQAGAVALRDRLRQWLGITGDNSDWGTGALVAILDTGVTRSPAFTGAIQMINLVDLPADLTTVNGHGTAVASMIIGNDAQTPGVAPAASVLSVRIADDSGYSDSFLLASGIVAAVDAGAQIINISMGSSGDSALVRNAITYALEHGALIVAAAGNSGTANVSYPAANAGVIAVGAVDALGNHLDFSSWGSQVALAAPGFEINAAWAADEAASVSGTSFSAPIVAGAIAAIMSQTGVTAAQAYQQLLLYANDGGAAGTDPELGAGMPDIGRVLTGTTPGVFDAAVASTRLLDADSSNPYGQVEILVQNRGTETLVNTAVQVSTSGAGATAVNITSLAPQAVQTVRVPVSQPAANYQDGLRVDARVVLSGGVKDAKPGNDRRVETYVPAVSN